MGYVVIVGGGNFGKELVKRFVNEGWKVTLIDTDPNVCKEVTETYGIRTVNGDGTDPEILDKVEVEKADIFIAATPKDEINILSGFLAREKEAKKIVVRISNKSYGKILEKAGFEYILPEETSADFLFEKIFHPNIKNFWRFSDFYFIEIDVNKNLTIIGKKLKELNSDKVKVLLYKKDKLRKYKPDEIITEGMKIYIISKLEPIDLIKKWEA